MIHLNQKEFSHEKKFRAFFLFLKKFYFHSKKELIKFSGKNFFWQKSF